MQIVANRLAHAKLLRRLIEKPMGEMVVQNPVSRDANQVVQILHPSLSNIWLDNRVYAPAKVTGCCSSASNSSA